MNETLPIPPRERPPGPSPSAAPGATDFILIELEEPKSGAAVRSGAVLTGGGWVIANRDIAEIIVHLDEEFLCHAMYGNSRPDIAAKFPHYPHADHSGFRFSGKAAGELTGQRHSLQITVRTEGGASAQRTIALAGPPADAGDPSDAGEAGGKPAHRSALEPPPLRIELESARVDAGGILRLSGWIITLSPLQEVALYLGDQRLGAPELDIARPDVAANYPQYPNAGSSGFRLVQDIGSLKTNHCVVRVRAACAGGIRRQIMVPLEVASTQPEAVSGDVGSIQICCDNAAIRADGAISVAGWAVSSAGITTIGVELDGTPIGEAEIGRARPDVGNRFPRMPGARNSGFRFARTLERPIEGEHLLRLVVRDGEGETRTVPLPLHVEAAARSQPELRELVRAAAGEIRFDIDTPALSGERAAEPVRGLLTIGGWAVAEDGPVDVEVRIDERSVGAAHVGIRREDIAAVFPENEDALLSGFALTVPQRLIGEHTVRVVLRSRSGQIAERAFEISAESPEQSTADLTIRSRLAQAEIALGLALIDGLGPRPSFDLLIALDEPPEQTKPQEAEARLRRTLETLRRQAYAEWRAVLLLPDEPSALWAVASRAIAEAGLADRMETRSWSEAVFPERDAASAHGPGFLLPLRAGDRLGADALLELAIESALNPAADFIYSDERRYDPVLQALRPFFKPDWSPDLLLSTNYIGRLWCARSELVRAVGLGTAELQCWGEYHAVLRLTERAGEIRHVSKILCERVEFPTESAQSEQRALQLSFSRQGGHADILPGAAAGIYRAKRRVETDGLVSIIIPTCAARGLVAHAVRTIRERTAYPNVEIVCIDNVVDDRAGWKTWLRENADQLVEVAGPFNWSRFNNVAAAAARGEFLLFLNDDIEVLEPAWLHALLEHAQRPEIGAVGPQLLYPNGRVQHAGMFLSGSIGRHAFRFAPADEPGAFGLALTQRNVIGITGACMLMRRATFEAMGGFDEAHSVVNNDLDFCLRLWSRGLRVVFTPYASLIHHELVSRAKISDVHDDAAFKSAWQSRFLKGDPFFSPRLLTGVDDYAPDTEPVEALHAGQTAMGVERVRAILAVKLDHIGDFILAFPALRRLKQRFPAARLCVLGPTASKALAFLEPCIDEFIEFNFFHARSSLGNLAVDEAELQVLQARLEPYRFDIALDLRMQPETRHVLQYTGAGLLAGFEHAGRFPWLDVVLEWEGDQGFTAKRAHIGEQLLRLAEAVAIACDTERANARLPAPADAGADTALLARLAGKRLPRGFLRKKLVCIHPGVGSEMRQWSPASFAALIELLVREEDVRVVLIGVGEETAIAREVMENLADSSCVVSLVGRVGLKELPNVLRACKLYVGNNSGPQHIAATLGVPTLGVYSGNVDPTEWAPAGPRAVAIRRRVACSPCYISVPTDCHRHLACLRGITPNEVYAVCRRLLHLGDTASNPTAAPQSESITEP